MQKCVHLWEHVHSPHWHQMAYLRDALTPAQHWLVFSCLCALLESCLMFVADLAYHWPDLGIHLCFWSSVPDFRLLLTLLLSNVLVSLCLQIADSSHLTTLLSPVWLHITSKCLGWLPLIPAPVQSCLKPGGSSSKLCILILQARWSAPLTSADLSGIIAVPVLMFSLSYRVYNSSHKLCNQHLQALVFPLSHSTICSTLSGTLGWRYKRGWLGHFRLLSGMWQYLKSKFLFSFWI